MRPVRISENFVPVSEFKSQAADWLRRLGESDAPVIVTQHGKPAGVLLSPQAFDELTERARIADEEIEGGEPSAHEAVSRIVRRPRVGERIKKTAP